MNRDLKVNKLLLRGYRAATIIKLGSDSVYIQISEYQRKPTINTTKTTLYGVSIKGGIIAYVTTTYTRFSAH